MLKIYQRPLAEKINSELFKHLLHLNLEQKTACLNL